VLMVKRSAANTIELGGVATGKQKAQLQAIAAGIISISGGKSKAKAAAASTGISNVAVAVFEVTSVKKLTANAKLKISNHKGRPASPCSPSPIIVLKPLLTKPLARAIPPANSNKIPQGIATASRHSSNALPSW